MAGILKAKRPIKIRRVLWIILYAAGLAFFYLKYVPLVRSYQLVLVPLLLATVVLTWKNMGSGTLFFIFAFPLINNLPYFFGIYEPIPHAPAALVLFLFFFLGYLLRGGSRETGDPVGRLLVKPLTLFALLVGASALITFFRYANFFPFLTPEIYELKTNTFGIRSGGAIMSVVFQALNYLTGLGFFLIFLKTSRTMHYLRKALFALCLSSLFSLAFALVQHFGHGTLGNNPLSIKLHLINGTFKDALSFGTFLSMAAPLFLGVFFAFHGTGLKLVSLLTALLSYVIIGFTGSKSGVVSIGVSTLSFFILRIAASTQPKKGRLIADKKKYLAAFLSLVLILGISLAVLVTRNSIMDAWRRSTIAQRFQNSKNMLLWRMEMLWKPALRMMSDYPLTGVGMGGFIVEAANYSDAYTRTDVVPESSENYILQVGSELGILGILLVIWMAWSIFRQLRKGWRSIPAFPDSRLRILWAGALSGIVAFIINAQTHTYIGSYEIKYAFWFLVGLIFILPAVGGAKPSAGRKDASAAIEAALPPRGKRFDRSFKVMAMAVVMLYATVHFWNSTHSLSLKARTEQLGLVQEFGLDKPETTADGREFRWTREYGGMPIKIEKPVMVIPIHASHPDIRQKPIQVKFILVKNFFKQKKLLKEITLSQSYWQDVTLGFPKEDIGQDAILLLKVSRTWNPLKVKGVPDPRNLGVAVGKITFRDS